MPWLEIAVNDRPLPLDIARSLVSRFGRSAIEIANNRAIAAEDASDMRDHDHAMMVLNEVEELFMEMDGGGLGVAIISNHRIAC
jgi:hypothetical protein